MCGAALQRAFPLTAVVTHIYTRTAPPAIPPPPTPGQDEISSEQLEQMLRDAADAAAQGGARQGKEVKVELDSREGRQGKKLDEGM